MAKKSGPITLQRRQALLERPGDYYLTVVTGRSFATILQSIVSVVEHKRACVLIAVQGHLAFTIQQ